MAISLPWLRLHPSDVTGRGNVTALANLVAGAGAHTRSCCLHHSAVLPALPSAACLQCGSTSMASATEEWGGSTLVRPVIWKILRMLVLLITGASDPPRSRRRLRPPT